jgi:hypothetical protein
VRPSARSVCRFHCLLDVSEFKDDLEHIEASVDHVGSWHAVEPSLMQCLLELVEELKLLVCWPQHGGALRVPKSGG